MFNPLVISKVSFIGTPFTSTSLTSSPPAILFPSSERPSETALSLLIFLTCLPQSSGGAGITPPAIADVQLFEGLHFANPQASRKFNNPLAIELAPNKAPATDDNPPTNQFNPLITPDRAPSRESNNFANIPDTNCSTAQSAPFTTLPRRLLNIFFISAPIPPRTPPKRQEINPIIPVAAFCAPFFTF